MSSVQRDPSGFRRQGYGTEFTSNAVLHWSKERQVELHYIAPGEPMQNGYIESFNGRMAMNCSTKAAATQMRRVSLKIEGGGPAIDVLQPSSRPVSSFSRDGQVPSDTFIDNANLMAETTGRGEIMPTGVHAPRESRS